MKEDSRRIAAGLSGDLRRPAHARGLVLLVDGSEGLREQSRHRVVAGYLQRRDFATLQLRPQPEAAPTEPGDTGAIAGLTRQLDQALAWIQLDPELARLPTGLFGSGWGGAAAIVCAAERPGRIRAVVARAAPLDRVPLEVERVQQPVLLVVAGLDADALDVARQAYRRLGTEHKRLEVVARATHVFEEAGALERVALATAAWFETHLGGAI